VRESNPPFKPDEQRKRIPLSPARPRTLAACGKATNLGAKIGFILAHAAAAHEIEREL
jgi:hypothetical protein